MEPLAPQRVVLTAEEAEQLVEDRIQEFGLGALPRISVIEKGGRWRIMWDGNARIEDAMTEPAWLAWLRANVGEIAPEALGSNEG